MSFLADFEPALIHSPFDRQRRQKTGSNSTTDSFTFCYKPSEKVISNSSIVSSISSLTTQEIRKVNGTSSITTVMPTSFSSSALSSIEQISYDRKYWTDKLVTFMLMMPY
jgi:hypothetical protein